MFIGMKLRSSQCQPSDSYSGSHGIAQRNTSFLKRLPFLCKLLHAFSFISNTLMTYQNQIPGALQVFQFQH